MDEFLAELQSQGVEFLFEEILHGFHVVVGHRFDFLDAHCVGLGEVAVDVAESFE